MKFNKLLVLLGVCGIIFSCNDEKKGAPFVLKIENNGKKLQLGNEVKLDIKSKKGKTIDSVVYSYAGKKVELNNGKLNLGFPLGEQPVEAKVYAEGETYNLAQNIIVHAKNSPKIYTYEIVNTYPHDIKAYTQGLEFFNDTLYESTGQYGESSLRKVDLETGEVIKKINLSNSYFGEGITILNNKIYQLTWRSGDGLVYDLNTFERLEVFKYNESKEGWGLCNDGKKLYKSDGTNKIWTLNPETLEEGNYIQPVTHTSTSSRLNELEWVDGKIYANTYGKDGVAIINPETGAIEGLIDFRGLREKVSQHRELDVLNGIAYNPTSKKLYVTGKNWDKLFEVKIIEK